MGIFVLDVECNTSFVAGDDVKVENGFISIYREGKRVALVNEEIFQQAVHFDSIEQLKQYFDVQL